MQFNSVEFLPDEPIQFLNKPIPQEQQSPNYKLVMGFKVKPGTTTGNVLSIFLIAFLTTFQINVFNMTFVQIYQKNENITDENILFYIGLIFFTSFIL